MYETTQEAMKEIAIFAEHARQEYENTKELTVQDGSTCMTIRVPVSLLNRIREMRVLQLTENM